VCHNQPYIQTMIIIGMWMCVETCLTHDQDNLDQSKIGVHAGSGHTITAQWLIHWNSQGTCPTSEIAFCLVLVNIFESRLKIDSQISGFSPTRVHTWHASFLVPGKSVHHFWQAGKILVLFGTCSHCSTGAPFPSKFTLHDPTHVVKLTSIIGCH